MTDVNELQSRWAELHRPMKERDRRELRFRMLEQLELERPFSFIARGETITLHKHPTGEVMLFTDGEVFYERGTGRPLFYLSFDGETVCRYGDGRAIYWAHGNHLYAYADPSGHGPSLYFDPAGQREQCDKYEKKVKERERIERELKAFDERASRRSIEQQQVQMASPYRVGLLRRLLNLLQGKD